MGAGVVALAGDGAAFAGAGFSGPLMPHPPIATVASSAVATHVRRASLVGRAQFWRNIGRHASTRSSDAIRARGMMHMASDTEFIASADATLATIGQALDDALAQSDVDLDWSLNDGILEIECEDGSKLIVNRHVPNRELWVAARSGGFHFRPQGGAWRDTRSGTELAVALTDLLAAQAGLDVDLPALIAPA